MKRAKGKKHTDPHGAAPKLPRPWQELRRRFPKHPALKTETLYSLPPDLISSIDEHIPGFLKPEDLEFELSLAEHEDVGFFRQGRIVAPVLPWSGRLGVADPILQERIDRSSANINHLLDQLLIAGCTGQQIQDILTRRAEVAQQVELRQQGYVGWLVTNPAFRGDLDKLRHGWDEEHKNSALLPSLPLELFGQRRTRPAAEVEESEHNAIKFLWKWGLQGFGSWDLPLPLSPALSGPSLCSLTDQENAGVVLFVPWYFLVNRDMGLEKIIDQHRLEHPLPHLAAWIRGRQSTKFGVARFALLLQVYVLLELALRPRYAERIERNLGRLDLAIASYLSSDEDRRKAGRVAKQAENIRRVRLELRKRLRTPEKTTP